MRRSAPLYAALAAVLVGALAGCSGDSSDSSPPAPTTAPPTPLSAFDTSGLAVARADLCDLVPDAAVTAALGAAGDLTSYAEGDRALLAAGLTDRSGEFACSWTAADGTVARAWVFAPPVSRQRARGLVRLAAADPGCRRVDAPAYGDPSVATLCRAAGTRTAAYAGLFGDAWLTCSMTGPQTDLRERAGRWCVAVASAAEIT